MAGLPDLDAWAIFARLAETASFTQTAIDLDLSKATVSKAIVRLETRLGTTLLNRTSRQVSLTDIGRIAAIRAGRLLTEAELMETEAMAQSVAPRGVVRMAAPMSFGNPHLAAELPALLALYPHITIDLYLSDDRVDVVAGGYDLALRIASLTGSPNLREIPVSEVRRLLVGSPDYFERRGYPAHPNDLASHTCIAYALPATAGQWRFLHASGEEVIVNPVGPLRINNGDALMPAVLAGLGIAVRPENLVSHDIAAGRLRAVMLDWVMPATMLHIVTPAATYQSASVAAVVEFLQRRFTLAPWALANHG